MVTITETAAGKVQELLSKEGKEGSALRLFVTGGGCAGYSYGMAFDEAREDDQVIDQNGVKLLVDEESGPLVDGAVIDYLENLTGSGFTIQNPNAARSCGCGHSFNTNGGKVESHC